MDRSGSWRKRTWWEWCGGNRQADMKLSDHLMGNALQRGVFAGCNIRGTGHTCTL